jgi:predicted lysophospholipase L1 biosynthesis ABC-type transport system permease subunit
MSASRSGYLWDWIGPPDSMHIVVRTSLVPAAIAGTIANVVHEIEPSVPVARLREMGAVFAESIRRPRLLAELVGVFAGLALLLTAVGTYGMLSYMVADRRREIGIRLALGSSRSRILALILQHGLRLAAAGVIAGLAGAVGVTRLMTSLLFGIGPTDVTTLAVAITGITAAAAIASALPAWRASRLDPNQVLRGE